MPNHAMPRVVLERVLAAPPADVFRAWTDPEQLAVFMRPQAGTAATVEADVRVGGRFRIVMHEPERDLVHTGEYRVVDPPRHLAFTWHSPVTGPDGSLVTIDLAPHPGGTRLVLTHEHLPPDVLSGHESGWTDIVDLLARRLGVAPCGSDAALRLAYDYPAPVAAVYGELTSTAGIGHWWTPHCEMDPVVGGRAVFRFPRANFHAVVYIDALDPPRHVAWHVVASRHPATSGYVDLHDWEGTRITFDLEPIDATRSRLRFAHHGLVPLECATSCTSAWSFFLGVSLAQYLATGTGQPSIDGDPPPLS
jgi:uncharacterized protein YndB with AHSA1/START domain